MPKNIVQVNKPEPSKSDVDKLNTEKTQDTNTEKATDKEELQSNEKKWKSYK
ncbi:hypothetical protein [Wolbachia endosymbiont of Atemnus politus]|uniref:hypothetical protein n=1 Tax=Wolbachia endosymbiont of Atemnus politus TaxID=2682840 RepID=UPI0015743796|nr:hypothetical protein [Wolbachia endosymbiont of Atemnus politus]